MYPPPKTPLPSTSGFVPRPTPTFQPIAPAASPEPVNTHHTNEQQNAEHLPPAPVPQVNQQLNYQVRPPQFNQQFTQPSLPQVSLLLTPPQPFNPQVLLPYFP